VSCGPPETGVTGTIWRDLDSDGVRDAGEPGIAGVVVGQVATDYRAVTDANGGYQLALPPGTRVISVLTGWLSSKCVGDLSCAAGRGTDSDYGVTNQFPKRAITLAEGDLITGLDAGFLPDHGDPTGAPTSRFNGNDDRDGSAAGVDLAVRHSAADGGFNACTDPNGTRVCQVGDRLTTNAQVYNQGTSSVSNVRFLVSVPVGARLVGAPVANPTTSRACSATGRSGSTSDGGQWIEYELDSPLPAAATAWIKLNYEITAGPPSPLPYQTGNNRDRKAFIAITALIGTDRDSIMDTDPFDDKDAGHNVNWPIAVDEDASDSASWNTPGG